MEPNRESEIEGQAADHGVPRPQSLAEFNGQSAAKDNLAVYIASARKLQAPLDHVLFDGPPGVGKTTLAAIVANEMGARFHSVSAPSLKQPADVFAMLSVIEAGDVLFMDEVHRLSTVLEENLHEAMEDFTMSLVVGEPGSARIVKVPLPPFTLIGATTRRGDLSTPFRDRFGIAVHLQLYTQAEMELVVSRAVGKLGFVMETEAVAEVARRSRGTPRIGLRITRRVRDFAVAAHDDATSAVKVTVEAARASLDRIGIDEDGLDATDRRYIEVLRDRFHGGPVGLKTLATAMGENDKNIEDSIEPYLIMKGIVDKRPRGRVLVKKPNPLQGFLFPS
jgi:Holliday junction DNA helicase RuvB